MARYVRKDRRIYDFSHCKACGTCWGAYPDKKCPETRCLACGTVQCLGNGLGNGTCSICYVGLLEGWSGWKAKCAYKGCECQAVARVPRKGLACVKHLANSSTDKGIAASLAERDKSWVLWEG